MTTTVAEVETFDPLIKDDNTIEQIRAVCVDAVQQTFARHSPESASGDMAILTYQFAVPEMTKALAPLGWVYSKLYGQPRWRNMTRYPRPVELVFTSAKECAGAFKTTSKGAATFHHTRQLDLFDIFPVAVSDFDFYTVFIDWSQLVHKYITLPSLVVTLAQTVVEGRNKHVVLHDRRFTIFNDPLYQKIAPSELPPPTSATIVITELEDEAQENNANYSERVSK